MLGDCRGCLAFFAQALIFGGLLGIAQGNEHRGVHQLGHALGAAQRQDAPIGGDVGPVGR